MSCRYWATSVSGGAAGSLDSIDPTDTDGNGKQLASGDSCRVVESELISEYIAIESASASESLPDVVIPDNNPGSFWWSLVEQFPQNTGVIDSLIYENIDDAF